MAHNIKKYANTHKQELFKHLFAVGILSTEITKLLTRNKASHNLLLAAFNAGCLHDIGKLQLAFQKWVVKSPVSLILEDGQHVIDKKNYNDHNALHHEISWLLLHLARDESDKSVNRKIIELMEHVIFWHHAKAFRKEPFKNLRDIRNKISDDELSMLIKDVHELIDQINALSPTYKTIRFIKDENDISLKLSLPKFKDYNTNDKLDEYKNDIKDNANNAFIRSIVITADRLISGLSVEELDNYISTGTFDKLAAEHLMQDDKLSKHITDCLDNFHSKHSKRNEEQQEAALKLAKVNGIAVLQGAAGCGKTKIALEWALKTNAKKIIWVCPRVSVCQNIYHDLTSEEYLNHVNIEICTGALKFIKINGVERPNDDAFTGDIIITTIDQLSNTILTHRHITTLLDAVNSHVVFDEFHEYITMDAYNLLFCEFLQCKKMLGDHTNTLLVSATPNPVFLKELLDVHKDDCIKVKTFNDKLYTIRLQHYNADVMDDNNPMSNGVQSNSSIISNVVSTPQIAFLLRADVENAILLHGKFLPYDSKILFEQVMQSFGNHGDKSFDILRSSHIIQASINISFGHMVSEVSHAENTLQRLGRLNRFAEHDSSELVIAIPTNFNKSNIGCGKFLHAMHIYDSTRSWIDFLSTKKLDNITLNDIYSYYDEFYNHPSYRQVVTKDILKSLRSSVGVIDRNVMDPVSGPKSTKGNNRLSANSLRGSNFYGQMAVCVVAHNIVIEYAKRYAYDENNVDNALTVDYNKIVGYGDSNKNLLAHAQKKHHKYTGAKKHPTDMSLLNAARSPETPLHLSYIVGELAKSNEQNHPCALYYVEHAKQAIGMMETKYLNFQVVN